jgi:predicted kinase
MANRPRCVIVTGRPGSGKTTLAKRLGQRLWMPVISRDEIKEGYVNTFGVKHDQLPPETNGVVSDFFFEIVNRYLANKVSVVIEAAFQHKVWAPRMAGIAELGDPFVVVCSVDGELAAKRHLRRGLDDPKREYYHGDRRVPIFRETGTMSPPAKYVPPRLNVPTLLVSTEEGYSPTEEEIVIQIESSAARQPGAPDAPTRADEP